MKVFLAKIIFSITIVLECFKSVFSQDLLEISLNDTKENKVGKKGTYVYYHLSVDSNILNSKDALQIVVRPLGEELAFSDPDIYVSSTNKQPTIKDNEWFSESFGMDIITIEPEELNSKNVKDLYIGVTCEDGNCPFKLKIQNETEIEIELNYQISMRLNKNQDTIFKLKFKKNVTNPPIKMLQVSVWSPNFAEYQVIMKDNVGASSSNSIKFSPAWVGASSVLIEEGDLCEECTYHILIYPKTDDAVFILNTDIGTDFFDFKFGNIAFGIANSYDLVCHKKPILRQDKKIIVSAMLFSGRGRLYIFPGETILTDLEKSKYSLDFKDEIVFAIDKSELEYESGSLMLCFQSYFFSSSYTLNVYDERDSVYQQLNNILFKGVKIPGYLPPKSETKYSIIDSEKNSNITISYEVKKGNPVMYGYICNDECAVNKAFIETHINEFFKAELSLPFTNSTDIDSNNANRTESSYVIRIPESANNCELSKSSFNCLPIVVVKCAGDEECIFNIKAIYGHTIVQLNNAISHHNSINFGSNDFYFFNVSEDVDKITILLTKLVGDAAILVKKDSLPVEGNYDWSSLQELFTPDIINISKKDKKSSLIGTYYISVVAESFSSYSILYYTTTSENKNTNSTIPTDEHTNTQHVGIDLKNGMTMKGFLGAGEYFRVFELHKDQSNDDDVKFFLASLKEKLNLYIYTSNDFLKKFDAKKGVKEGEEKYTDMFSDYNWKIDDILMNDDDDVIIKSSDKNYLKEGSYYAVVCRRYAENDRNATFYLTGVHSNYPIVLQEGLLQIDSLYESNNYSSQDYLAFLYKGQEASTVNINTFYGQVQLDIFGSKNNTIKCSTFCKTLLSFDDYCVKTVESCAVMLVVSQRSDWKAKFSINIKHGDSTTPEYLVPGVSKSDSIYEGDSHYYMYNIDPYDNSTYVFFSFEEGVIDVFARLITFESKIFSFPESSDESELLQTEYSYRGGQAIPLHDVDLKKCFLDPKNPSANNSLDCVLLITIKGSYSFNPDKSIYYKIDYSGYPNYVPTDSPIYGEVSYSQYSYFKFNIPKGIDFFSVSLSHATGFSILLLNKGEKEPISYSDWTLGDWRPQIYEITKNDPILNGASIDGTYTGAVYSDKNITYNLYINTHPKRVEEVDEYSVSRCTKKKGEKCYYAYLYSAYLLFDDFVYRENTFNYNDLIFVSHLEYVYGDAVMYAKLVNKDLDSFDDALASEKDYDASSKDQNSRNFLKLIVSKKDPRLMSRKNDTMSESYTSPIIMFTIDCLNDCDVKFKVRDVRSNFYYLDTFRENLVYVPSNSLSYLQYYVYTYDQQGFETYEDQEMQFILLSGSANFKIKEYDTLDSVYIKPMINNSTNSNDNSANNVNNNNTTPDNKGDMNQNKDEGKLLSMFKLSSKSDHWITTIDKLYSEKFIVVEVETKEKSDVGFAVLIKTKEKLQELSFNLINIISSDVPFNFNQTKYVYFQLHEKYQNVTFNLNTDYEDPVINMYGKYITLSNKELSPKELSSKDDFNDSILKKLSESAYPDAVNKDFGAFNSKGGISYLNIPQLENDYDKFKAFVVITINIAINNTSINQQLSQSNIPLFSINLEKFDKREEFNTWSVELYENQKFTDIIFPKEVKIFQMTKMDPTKDYLIIHIDRCDASTLKFKLTDQIVFNNTTDPKDKSNKLPFHLDTRDSRYLIKIDAPKSDYFLTVWNHNDPEVNNLESAFYMIQFYYFHKSRLDNAVSIWSTNPVLSYELNDSDITLTYHLPDAVTTSKTSLEARYKVYVTTEKAEFEYYNSLCYLNSANEVHAYFDKNGRFTFSLDGKGTYYIGLTGNVNGETFVYNPIEVVFGAQKGVSWTIISKFIFLSNKMLFNYSCWINNYDNFTECCLCLL